MSFYNPQVVRITAWLLCAIYLSLNTDSLIIAATQQSKSLKNSTTQHSSFASSIVSPADRNVGPDSDLTRDVDSFGCQYLTRCHKNYTVANSEQLEKLRAGTALVTAWLQVDIERALKQSRVNMATAKRLKSRNGLAMAYMHQASILIRFMKLKEARESFELAEKTFQLNVDDAFSVGYLSTKYNYLHTDIEYRGVSAVEVWEHLENAIERCPDSEEKLWAKVGLLNLQVFNKDIEFNRDDVELQIVELRNLGANFHLGLVEAICLCLESKLALRNGNQKEFMRIAPLLKEVLEREGSVALKLLQNSNNLMFQHLRQDFGQMKTEIERGIQLASQLKSPEEQFSMINALGSLETLVGNYENASRLLAKAEAFPNKPYRPLLLDSYYRWGLDLSNKLESLEGIHKFSTLLCSEGHRTRIAKQQKQFKELTVRINELKNEKLQTQAKFQAERLELTKARNKAESVLANYRIASLTLLAGFAISGLGIALLYSFRKLGTVRDRLNDEIREADKQRKHRYTAEQRLVRLQRMESLGLLAGGIAHDFNNLLVGVLGNAELLQHKPDANREFIDDRVSRIVEAAEKATELSNQMLAYSGHRMIEKSPQDLNELLTRLEPLLNSHQDSEISVNTHFASEPMIALVDQTQIDQVILNLVSNARKASSHPQTIDVKISHQAFEDHEIWTDSSLFGTRTEGGEFAVIEIHDKGTGIPEENVEHIFDPFYGNSEVGRGLGLAVVYGVVSGHDGLIRIDSKLGKGTVIRIYLPRHFEELETTVASPHFTSKTVLPEEVELLVVDDEPTVVEWIANVAQIEGFAVTTTNDAGRAIEMLTERNQYGQPFSCVILDVVMPGIDGNDVLDAIQEQKIDTPVIIMSGYNPGRLSQLGRFQNVVGILEKPFSATDFLRLVSTAVGTATENRQTGTL